MSLLERYRRWIAEHVTDYEPDDTDCAHLGRCAKWNGVVDGKPEEETTCDCGLDGLLADARSNNGAARIEREMGRRRAELSVAAIRLLRCFTGDEERYGKQLVEALGSASGSVYPLLHRMGRYGWLAVREENVDPRQVGRPTRRLYRITPQGAAALRAALATLTATYAEEKVPDA